ncbi:MAG: carboxylating nicotinate-nucleotide diphosphorylase [Oligoflexales bacterium]|nr:carboxylating nicotinate-nucleotide diphosphorylase [Oligoflexales bacterium]
MQDREELHQLQLETLVERALDEDRSGDWASKICVRKGTVGEAEIVARSQSLASGLELARMVFTRVDPSLQVEVYVQNAQSLLPGKRLLRVRGEARSILKAEGVALHFLKKMCGISQRTSEYVDRLKGHRAKLLDARNPSPGLRLIENRAVSIGGARGQRLCLTDAVLVKENHIRAAGSITQAVNRLLESLPPTLKIKVEVQRLEEVHEAVDAGADMILLENMSIAELSMAVRTVQGRVLLEASGPMSLERAEDVAATGVDFISTCSLLHPSPWADLQLKWISPFLMLTDESAPG